MSIPLQVIKKLYAKSGNICAFPGCNNPLSTEINHSEIAHIISPKTNGPRHIDGYNGGNYDDEENLILLCPIHHHQIDTNPDSYPIDWLKNIKKEHEEYVSKSLQPLNIDQNFINDFVAICQANHIEEIICNLTIGASFSNKLFEYEQNCCFELEQFLKTPQSVRISKKVLSGLYKFMYALHNLYNNVFACYGPSPTNTKIAVFQNNASSQELDELRKLQEWLRKTYSNYRFTDM